MKQLLFEPQFFIPFFIGLFIASYFYRSSRQGTYDLFYQQQLIQQIRRKNQSIAFLLIVLLATICFTYFSLVSDATPDEYPIVTPNQQDFPKRDSLQKSTSNSSTSMIRDEKIREEDGTELIPDEFLSDRFITEQQYIDDNISMYFVQVVPARTKEKALREREKWHKIFPNMTHIGYKINEINFPFRILIGPFNTKAIAQNYTRDHKVYIRHLARDEIILIK